MFVCVVYCYFEEKTLNVFFLEKKSNFFFVQMDRQTDIMVHRKVLGLGPIMGFQFFFSHGYMNVYCHKQGYSLKSTETLKKVGS